jgi:hypothetical protein
MDTSSPIVGTDHSTKKAAINNAKALSEAIVELRVALRSVREKIAQLENNRAFTGPERLKTECDRLIQANSTYFDSATSFIYMVI